MLTPPLEANHCTDKLFHLGCEVIQSYGRQFNRETAVHLFYSWTRITRDVLNELDVRWKACRLECSVLTVAVGTVVPAASSVAAKAVFQEACRGDVWRCWWWWRQRQSRRRHGKPPQEPHIHESAAMYREALCESHQRFLSTIYANSGFAP
jgi:hypothetical protein